MHIIQPKGGYFPIFQAQLQLPTLCVKSIKHVATLEMKFSEEGGNKSHATW